MKQECQKKIETDGIVVHYCTLAKGHDGECGVDEITITKENLGDMMGRPIVIYQSGNFMLWKPYGIRCCSRNPASGQQCGLPHDHSGNHQCAPRESWANETSTCDV